MKWSWKIGEFAGIGVYLHATFFLLIAWVALSQWAREQSISVAVNGTAFIVGLFVCVVLHEFGHALTARRYGIKTWDITLLPIGGVARLDRMPDPAQERAVAIAGPEVNVVIAAGLALWLQADGFESYGKLSMAEGPFAQRLMVLNLGLAAFNLLPAFPMDGGRVLRALLATRLEYTRATHIASSIGQGLALLFGFLGFLIHPFLLFLALLVWIGAAQEASATQSDRS